MSQIVIGVDLGVRTCVSFNSNKQEIKKVSQDAESLESWLNEILLQKQASEASEVFILSETFKHPLIYAAQAYGFTIATINPVQVSKLRAAFHLCDAKDDARDAKAIVEFWNAKKESFRIQEPVSEEVATLQQLVSFRQHLVKSCTASSNKLRQHLRIAHPTFYAKYTGTLNRQWIMKMLMIAPTSLHVESLDGHKNELRYLFKLFGFNTVEELTKAM